MLSKPSAPGDFWADVADGGASDEAKRHVDLDAKEGGFNLWFSCTIDGELPNSKTSPQTATPSNPLRFAPHCGQCLGCNQKKACINQQAGDKVNF